MAEFSLPKNSKVQKGRHFPAKDAKGPVRTFKVYRWSPDDDANPRVDTYDVDMGSCGPMVARIWLPSWFLRVTMFTTPATASEP